MKILSTGSNGLLAQKIIFLALKESVNILATSKGVDRSSNFHQINYEYLSLDITNKDQVSSVINKFNNQNLDKDINSEVKIDNYKFEYSNDEIKVLKKLSEWPKSIDTSCTRLEPHRIPIFLYELASEFHSYWNLGKQNPDKRFIDNQGNISNDKL